MTVHQFNTALADVPMAGLGAVYRNVRSDVPPSAHENQCVLDYILWEAGRIGSRKTLTRAG